MMQADDVYQPDLSTLDIKEPAQDVVRPAVAQSSPPDLLFDISPVAPPTAPVPAVTQSSTPDLLFDGSPFAPQTAQVASVPAAAYTGGVIDLSTRPTGGAIDLSVPHMGSEQEQKVREQEHSFTGQATAVLRESAIHEYLPTQIQEVLAPAEQQSNQPEDFGPEAQQRRAAERACEGRWVPSYMRQQLIENGHTEIPRQPNAHEYRSTDGTPPSLYEAIKGMGEEIGQLLYAALGGFFDLTAQCKRAAHKVTENVHHVGDGVTIESCDELCPGLCGSPVVNGDQGDPEAIPPVIPETTPTLGPIRSRLRRELPCKFEVLALLAKMRLLTPHAPPELQRLVKRREFVRQTTDHKSASERWHLICEPGIDASPRVANFPQLDPGASSSQLREIWQVYPKYCRASVEISNEPSWATKVLVCLKMDIVELSDGANCEIDSRLYMLPRDRDPDRQEADLPTSLIEALIDAHHVQTERVRDLVMAMVAADDNTAAGGVQLDEKHLTPAASDVQTESAKPAAKVKPPTPRVHRESPRAPEAPAWDLPGQPSHPSQDEGTSDQHKNLMLRMADGI